MSARMAKVLLYAMLAAGVFIGMIDQASVLKTGRNSLAGAIMFVIILGALLQVGSTSWIVTILAALSILMASVNIFGGFLVTYRMLSMFKKKGR